MNGHADDGPYTHRVLVTGFGPFTRYKVNPSWLAVQPLHNTVLDLEPLPPPTDADPDVVIPARPRRVHITALEVPVIYEDVLAIVPGLHTRPPTLPGSRLPDTQKPPPEGYDLIVHVGVAGRGPLRMERLGHKFGYNMKDANGNLAPTVRVTHEEANIATVGDVTAPAAVAMTAPAPPSEAEMMERARLGDFHMEPPTDPSDPPKRGFGKGYETFQEEIYTDVDVEKLVAHLKKAGIEQIYKSMDAGHYLCDFIYYCSLAEAKRNAKNQTDKPTKVLFMHCPPVGMPLTSEYVAEAIKKSIIWLCGPEA